MAANSITAIKMSQLIILVIDAFRFPILFDV